VRERPDVGVEQAGEKEPDPGNRDSCVKELDTGARVLSRGRDLYDGRPDEQERPARRSGYFFSSAYTCPMKRSPVVPGIGTFAS
jgi:hypothetical protein